MYDEVLMYVLTFLAVIVPIIIFLYFNSKKNAYQCNSLNDLTDEETLEEIRAIKKELFLKPFNASLYFNLGNFQFKLHRYKKALSYYKIFEKLNGVDKYVCFNKALSYKHLGDLNNSQKYFLLALEYDNSHIYALLELSNIELNRKEYHKAKEYAMKAYDVNNYNSDVLFSLGVICIQLNEYNKAIEFLKSVTEIEENPNASYFLGLAYLDMKLYEKSIEAFTLTIEIDENNGPSYLKRGIAKTFLSDQTALDDFNKAELLIPENKEIALARFQYHNSVGDIALGIENIKPMLENDSSNVSDLIEKGMLLGEHERYEESMSCFKKVLKIMPNHRDALYFHGLCKKEMQLMQEAKNEFENLLKLYPEDVGTFYDLAECYSFFGKPTEAIDYFQKHIDGKGFNIADSHFGLGTCYKELDDHDLAKENFFIAGTMGHLPAIATLAHISLEEKRFDDALFYYNQLKSADENFPMIDELIKSVKQFAEKHKEEMNYEKDE